MDITLPILILALPFTMFLILGIGGVKMSRKLAGVLGICGNGVACNGLYCGVHVFLQRKS